MKACLPNENVLEHSAVTISIRYGLQVSRSWYVVVFTKAIGASYAVQLSFFVGIAYLFPFVGDRSVFLNIFSTKLR